MRLSHAARSRRQAEVKPSGAPTDRARPIASSTFDWLMIGLSALMIAGLDRKSVV